MLVTQICREFHLGKIAFKMQSRVPRCLFGPPNPKETREMLNETLDTERQRFSRKWGVDLSEDDDKENVAVPSTVVRLIPARKRACPYAKQTAIYDYWRVKKVADPCKKPCSNGCGAFAEFNHQHPLRSSQAPVLQLPQHQQMQPLQLASAQAPHKSTEPLQTLSQNTIPVKAPTYQ